MSEWISVKDRLPEGRLFVLVVAQYQATGTEGPVRYQEVLLFDSKKFNETYGHVTHWKSLDPLPEAT